MLQGLVVVIGVLVLLSLVVQALALRRRGGVDLAPVQTSLGLLKDANERVERSMRDEIARNREEVASASREARGELAMVLKGNNDSLAQWFEALRASVAERLWTIQQESMLASKHAREELVHHLAAMAHRIETLTAANQHKADELKAAVELRLRGLQEDNAKQLEQMRATVDEKLLMGAAIQNGERSSSACAS